jgi:O-antigen ligase
MSVRLVRSGSGTGLAGRPFSKNGRERAAEDEKPVAWPAEAWVAVVILLVVALLRSTSKLTYSQAPEDSPVGQLVWSSMYLFAAYRLFRLRARALQIARRSGALVVFLGLVFVSVVWSDAFLVTLKDAIQLTGTTLVAWYFVTRFTLSQFLHIAAVVFAFIAVSSLALVFGSPARGRMDWGAGSWCGILPEKNALGAAMALTIFTIALSALHAKKWTNRIALAVVLLFACALLVGSNSITAAVVCAATGTSLAIAWAVVRKQYGIVIGMLLLSVVTTIVVFGVFGADSNTLFDAVGRSSNLTGRADLYPLLWQAVRDHPVFGFGYDAFFNSEALDPYLSDFIAQLNWVPPHAHNSFLQILLDLGALGLATFLVVLATAFKRAFVMLVRGRRAIDFWPIAVLLFLTLGSYDETYFAQANGIEWIFFLAAALYPIREALGTEAKVPEPAQKFARLSR